MFQSGITQSGTFEGRWPNSAEQVQSLPECLGAIEAGINPKLQRRLGGIVAMLTNLPNFDTAWREGQPAFLPVTYRFSLYSPFVCTYNIAVKFKKYLCCLTVNEARDMPHVLV